MNCFNIRELQSILKRKFFTDLVNTHDHRDLLEQSMIGLRYKTNNSLNLNSDVLSFYNFGITTNNLNKILLFSNNTSSYKITNLSNYNYLFINFFSLNSKTVQLVPFSFYITTICEYFSLIISFNVFFYPFFKLSTFFTTLLNNINFYIDLSNINTLFTNTPISNVSALNQQHYSLQDSSSVDNSIKNNFMESSMSTRYSRFFNVLVNYDYKTGHYIGN
jgi:hypothetical protein